MTAQESCSERPNGGSPEVSDDILRAMVLYVRALAVPARRDVEAEAVLEGQALFRSAGCASCHAPTLTTSATAELPELTRLEIHPYTDLLLHDLGPDLADQRPVFEASGSEWRTPPLWGLGLLSKSTGTPRCSTTDAPAALARPFSGTAVKPRALRRLSSGCLAPNAAHSSASSSPYEARAPPPPAREYRSRAPARPSVAAETRQIAQRPRSARARGRGLRRGRGRGLQQGLERALGQLAAAPSDAHLLTARSAWRHCVLAWKTRRFVSYGPFIEGNALLRATYFPVRPESIEQIIEGSRVIDARLVDEIGARDKGLFALEYVLFAGPSERPSRRAVRRAIPPLRARPGERRPRLGRAHRSSARTRWAKLRAWLRARSPGGRHAAREPDGGDARDAGGSAPRHGDLDESGEAPAGERRRGLREWSIARARASGAGLGRAALSERPEPRALEPGTEPRLQISTLAWRSCSIGRCETSQSCSCPSNDWSNSTPSESKARRKASRILKSALKTSSRARSE